VRSKDFRTVSLGTLDAGLPPLLLLRRSFWTGFVSGLRLLALLPPSEKAVTARSFCASLRLLALLSPSEKAVTARSFCAGFVSGLRLLALLPPSEKAVMGTNAFTSFRVSSNAV